MVHTPNANGFAPVFQGHLMFFFRTQFTNLVPDLLTLDSCQALPGPHLALKLFELLTLLGCFLCSLLQLFPAGLLQVAIDIHPQSLHLGCVSIVSA